MKTQSIQNSSRLIRRDNAAEICSEVIVPRIIRAVAAALAWIGRAFCHVFTWSLNKVNCCKTRPINCIEIGTNFSPIDHSLDAQKGLSLEVKRSQGLARLQEIKTRLGGNKNSIKFALAVPHINLDELLAPFNKTLPPEKFLELFDFAGPDPDDLTDTKSRCLARKRRFKKRLESYVESKSKSEGLRVTKESLSQLYSIWQKKIDYSQPDFTELKKEIREQLAIVSDAISDCPDQFNSQITSVLLDVLISELLASGTHHSKEQLLGAVALFRYQSDLLKKICIVQNPKEKHMADFERMVIQGLSNSLHAGGSLVSVGADYDYFIKDSAKRIKRVEREFFNRIHRSIQPGRLDERPLAFLMRELQTYYRLKHLRPLRAEMLKAVMQEYNIHAAYDSDFKVQDPVAKGIINTASRKGEDGFIDSCGWSLAGVLWFMEKNKLIKESFNSYSIALKSNRSL